MKNVALSGDARAALSDEDFAVPGKRRVPLPDARHVRMGWRQIDQAKDLTDHERTQGRLRIVAKAHDLGIDTVSEDLDALRLDAMAIEMPEVSDHPNRMPFSGVLVKLDQPSTAAPHGSNGKRIVMTTEAAERNLASLMGMAVDFTPDFDGHDAQRKIGVITGATVDGPDLRIEGFIYAADFPEEAATIKAAAKLPAGDVNALGFSFEAQQIHVESLDGDPLVITDCVFTGAAILKRLKAAYTTTSLAASAAGDFEMTKEEMTEAFSALLKPITDEIAGLKAGQEKIGETVQAGAEMQAKVKPHADKLRAAADGMEAAGIGMHPTRGHVPLLRQMADGMEAAAMGGTMPHIYRDHDYPGGRYDASADPKPAKVEDPEVVALKAQVAELTTKIEGGIAASRDAVTPPERKTLSPVITNLLAKAGVDAPEEGKKVGRDTVDKMLAGMAMNDRIRLKDEMFRAGMID